MATIASASPRVAAETSDFGQALKDAIVVGVIGLALFGPLIGLRTDQNMSNQLIVVPRWHLVAIIVGIMVVGRFLLSAFVFPWMAQRQRRPAKPLVTTVSPARARFRRLLPKAAVLLMILYPPIVLSLVGIQGSIKWVDNFGVQILIYVMLGWGLNIVVGLAGLLDLGYVAFYAVGAYSYALLSAHFGLSFWILLPLAGILAAFWGILLGFPVLRLRGDYLAIVTLAFGEIMRLVLINWREVTNGSTGLSAPKVEFFGIPIDASENGLVGIMERWLETAGFWLYEAYANLFGIAHVPDETRVWLDEMFEFRMSSAYYKIFLFYVILALAALTAFMSLRLRRMPIGRAWEALREDEIACRSLGINTTNTKLTAFAIGAMFAGFAGSFFAARQGFVSPESFVFLESAIIVAIVVLGGMGSMVGVAIAAAVMIGGTEILRDLQFLKAIFGDNFDPAHYRMLIFGLAMVSIMVWKPRGFVSSREPTAFLHERKLVSGDHVSEGHG
jgi:branched-chain amino acid transport system permease protein